MIYVSYLNDGTKIRAIRIYNEGYYEERVYVDDQLLLIKKSEALYKLKRLSNLPLLSYSFIFYFDNEGGLEMF